MNWVDALQTEQQRRITAESERDEWRTRAQTAEAELLRLQTGRKDLRSLYYGGEH